jgi:hypothetical protein
MRWTIVAGVALLALGNGARAAEEPFDACNLFTQADAQKALGTAVVEESNPKAKRPRVVLACAYAGLKDGKAVEAKATFRFGRTEGEIQKAFDDSKLQIATKPMLLRGADASFWSGKTGQMNVRKGRTWLTVSVGSPKPNERQVDPARALAEALAPRL